MSHLAGRERAWSPALLAARVLLGFEAVGLLGVSAVFAFVTFAFALWATADSQDNKWALQGLLFGAGLVGAGIVLGGAPLVLTFVRRRWAYIVLFTVQLLLALTFVLMVVLEALQPAPGLETDKHTWLLVFLLFAILPSMVCVLLLFSADLHRHWARRGAGGT
jgi:hypothetical protein